MKTINIQSNKSVQNKYEFSLGNGKRLTFTSKRYANAFIASTNRYLTECLVILNKTYTDTYIEYRNFWLVSANTHGGTKTNYMRLLAKIKSNMDAASDIMDKFNGTWGRSQDPFFAFIDLRKVALFTAEAAELLRDWYKKRNHTANYYNCLILHKRCLLVIENMQNWQPDEALIK